MFTHLQQVLVTVSVTKEKVGGFKDCSWYQLCMPAFACLAVIWPDVERETRSPPSSVRKRLKKKMTSKLVKNQQEVQTSLGAGIRREGETVAPPGCGTHEPQTRMPLCWVGHSPLCSKGEGGIRNLFIREWVAGWLICSLLFADGDDSALSLT